jgi:hypothetical protein
MSSRQISIISYPKLAMCLAISGRSLDLASSRFWYGLKSLQEQAWTGLGALQQQLDEWRKDCRKLIALKPGIWFAIILANSVNEPERYDIYPATAEGGGDRDISRDQEKRLAHGRKEKVSKRKTSIIGSRFRPGQFQAKLGFILMTIA